MKTAIAKRPFTEYDKALYIAAHFGFSPIEPPRVAPRDGEAVSDCDDGDSLTGGYLGGPDIGGRKLFDAAEKAAFLRSYQERGLSDRPHPVAVCYRKPDARRRDYALELVGFPGGSAEAILARTALSILSEDGHPSLAIELNSIGDKDSIAAYERELHNYVRRYGEELDADLKKRLRRNVFELMRAVKEGETLYDRLPQSIGSLSTPSRAHFKEVLEHIECLGVEFRLLPTLVGNRHFCSETLFTIRDAGSRALLAVGFRYPRLARRAGLKREIPLAGVSVFLDPKREGRGYKELPKSKFYLVQLGKEARLRAVPLLEVLRAHHIPVRHGLGQEKLIPQMEEADRARASHLLIIGQKEALEDSVTIRNVDTRAQDTIPLSRLPDYLKHLPL